MSLPTMLINNTNVDIKGLVEEVCWKALRARTKLPDELSDLFTLTVFEVDGETKARLDWK